MKELRISSYSRSSDEFKRAESWLRSQGDISGGVDLEFDYIWARMSDDQAMLYRILFPEYGVLK